MGNIGTTSTSSLKTVTGWHVLLIEGYSTTKGLPGGTCIKSSTFTVRGHRWYIGYFPGGTDLRSSGSNEYVGGQLNLHDPDANGEVLARFNFTVIHGGQKLVPEGNPNSQTNKIYIFSSRTPSHGIAHFIERKLESEYVKDNCFSLRCNVTVIKDIHAEEIKVEPSAAVPPPDLHRHLGYLLDCEVGEDVTFQVDGKLFMAHRYVLSARSSVFMAQLFGPMKEKTASHVRVDDMDVRVFKVMLRFIYTDMLTLPDMEEGEKTVMSQHLLMAADRYNMERLKLTCEDILRKRIDTDIVAITLVLAEKHGGCGLKNSCFRFLMSPGNLKTVMASDGFQHLKNSCPSLLDELLAKVAP